MTMYDELKALGKVQVGPDGSAEYGIVRSVFSLNEAITPREGIPASAGTGGRRVTWRLSVVAHADTMADVPALVASMTVNLNQVGKRVRLTLNGGTARDLPAEGAAGGSIAGYPRCEASIDQVSGTAVSASLAATTIIPAAIGGGGLNDSLVYDDHKIETTIDDQELVTVRRSGELRVVNGFSGGAAAFVTTNIITAARAAATTAGRSFTSKITQGREAAVCTYEYSDQQYSATSGGAGVTFAEVSDRTARVIGGRTEQTISGYALGASATTFAEGLRPEPDDPDLLIGDEVSAPRSTDGRVEFSFRVLKGATGVDDTPEGCVVFGYSEGFGLLSGGRTLQPSEYPSAAPLLIFGSRGTYLYEQVTRIEYRGCDEADMEEAEIVGPLVESGAVLAGTPIVRHERTGSGTIMTTIRRLWAAAAPLSPMPATREVLAL